MWRALWTAVQIQEQLDSLAGGRRGIQHHSRRAVVDTRLLFGRNHWRRMRSQCSIRWAMPHSAPTWMSTSPVERLCPCHQAFPAHLRRHPRHRRLYHHHHQLHPRFLRLGCLGTHCLWQFTLTIDQDVASFYGQLSRFKSNLTALTQADDAVCSTSAQPLNVVVDTRLLFASRKPLRRIPSQCSPSCGRCCTSAGCRDVNITGHQRLCP